jgi:hypothetical protein
VARFNRKFPGCLPQSPGDALDAARWRLGPMVFHDPAAAARANGECLASFALL